MNAQDILIAYLEFCPSKSCTIIGVVLLFKQFKLGKLHVEHALTELVKHGKIEIIEKDPIEETVIRLIPNLRSIK